MMKKSYLSVALSMVLALSACKGRLRDFSERVGENTDSTEVTEFFDADAQKQAANEASDARPKSSSSRVVKMMEMPAPLKDRPEKILRRLGFTVSYNKNTKTPNYVAWHLVKSHTYGTYQRDEQLFMPDEDVPSPRATDNDYYGSRLDRGHMCPAADNKWSDEALRQSFLFTNICPQNHGLNKDSWNDLEMQCRRWARKYGAIDVVCGPVYRNKTSPRTIGTNKVWVPDAFFKVVLCRKGKPKAIGFIYENRGGSQRMSDTNCTIDEVERLTGIDFFPMLADDVENRVEAESRLADW